MVRTAFTDQTSRLVPRLRPDADLASPFGFDRGRPKLTLVVDGACEPGEWLDLLLAFRETDRVEVLLTSGPAPSLQVDDYDGGGQPVGFRVARSGLGTTLDAIHLTAQYERFAAKAAAMCAITADRALTELLLAQAAKRHAHFLVTDSAFLLRDAPRGLVQDANPIEVRQALAIVGLYLRTEDEFLVEPRRDGRLHLSRRLFYRYLAWDLLPTAWLWFGACGESARSTGNETPLELADAALDRTVRALKARDHVLAQVQLPATSDTQDEALFYLDAAHLFLRGAFDAAALIADLVYELEGKPLQIGWTHNGTWRTKLGAAAPELAELIAPNTHDRNVIDLVAHVRNTIHREPLGGVAYSSSLGRVVENLILVPQVDEDRLLELIEVLGGRAAWGIGDVDGRTCFESDMYVSSLVLESARTLDRILAAIDTEMLPGVNVQVLVERRSARQRAGAYPGVDSPEFGRRLRLQAGLPMSTDTPTGEADM
jgi:hypothetical protein